MPLADLPGFKGSNRLLVEGLSCTTKHVASPAASEGTYIVNCQSSYIIIDTKTAKVSVDGCKDVKVYVTHSPLTSTLEICNSDEVHVFLPEECVMNTVMIDKSDNVTIHVLDTRKQLQRVWWHEVSKVYVEDGTLGRLLLDKVEDNNKIQRFQYVCKVTSEGTFHKEPVLRENGYPTTEERMEHFKKQQEIADKHMFKTLLKDLRMEENEMYDRLGMPPDLSPSGSSN